MRLRILSTLILWTVAAFAIVFAGSYGFAALIFVLSALSVYEFCAMLEKCGLRPMKVFAQLANAAIFFATVLLWSWNLESTSVGAAVFGICVFALICIALKDPYGDFISKSMVPTLLVICAVPFMLQWMVVICFKFDATPYTGVILAIWAIASAKFTDVGGYAVGIAFGRHKLSPSISPKKSWEGLLGGALSSMAVSIVIVLLLGEWLPDTFTPWTAAIASIPVGIAGLVSDLAESILKRRADVKDSGNIIPGIGGALDLSDSMLLSAPIAFLLLTLII